MKDRAGGSSGKAAEKYMFIYKIIDTYIKFVVISQYVPKERQKTYEPNIQ